MKAILLATLVGMAAFGLLGFAYAAISRLFKKCFGEGGLDAVVILGAIFLVAALPCFMAGVIILRVIFGVSP